MERPVPLSVPEAPARQGGGALRSTGYTLLMVLLAAGLWARFNPQIGAVLPMLTAPAGLLPSQFADPAAPRHQVQLALLPVGQTQEAVQAMGLPAGDAAALSEAVARGRLRLAHLPLLDNSPVDQGGHSVVVNAGGYRRQVVLTRDPVVVTVPVGAATTISFSTPETAGVDIVGLTLTGPVVLPTLQAGQMLTLGVIGQ